MTHEHLYTLLGGVCFRAPIPTGETRMLAIEEMASKVSTIRRDNARTHTMKIQINTKNFRNPKDNEVSCQEIVDWATNSKATSITDLRDSYKVEIDYCITSSTKQLIEEGTAVQTVSPQVVLVAQDIAEGNRLTYTKALKFDKLVKFTKAFPASYGAINQVSNSYILQIYRIRIKGISDLGFGDTKPNYYYPRVVDRTGKRRIGMTTPADGSILLLDTEVMGIKFDPEIISFRPRELCVDVNILFDEFCVFFDENQILDIIDANGGGPTSTTPPTEDEPPYQAPCHPNIHPHPRPEGDIGPCPGCPPDRPLDPPSGDDNCCGGPGCDDDVIWDLQIADPTTSPDEKIYTVVSDDLPEEEFDAESMIRYADAAERIGDIKVGDRVFWGYTLLL